MSQEELRRLEFEEQCRDWVATLSDKEYNEWLTNQAGIAAQHFADLESMIDEALDYIREHPHDSDNIKRIGMVIHSLGEMMQEFDYRGAIKIGIGHDAQSEILDKIASIVRIIRDGTRQ